MRTVLSNHSEVAHVWASQNQHEGRAGNMFFEGTTIYSYGYHFKIAKFHTMPNKQKVILFTADDYSISTTSHKSIAYDACDGLGIPTITMPERAWNDYQFGKEYLKKMVYNTLDTASRARVYAFGHCQTAFGYVLALREWARLHKRKAKYKFTDKQTACIKRAIYRKKNRVEIDKQAAIAKEKRDARQLQLFNDECGGNPVEYWHKFGRFPVGFAHLITRYSGWNGATLCRIVGDEVITSRQARVPVEHARKLYPVILRAKRNNTTYEPENPVRIGHFNLRLVRPDGSIQIGCHNIEWSEVEYIGKQIGAIN